jgi:phosphatidylglycerol:prolipoprotein diacylglycerol transferase
MHPILFRVPFPELNLFGIHIGPTITLHSYGFLLAVAFLAGLFVAGRQARNVARTLFADKEKRDRYAGHVTDMAVWVLIAGLVGAKLLLVAVDYRYFASNPSQLFSIFQSGGVFYGGLIGGALVAWWYARRHQLPGWATADALAPGVVLGQAIGRIGCFAAGCCWGKLCTLPWAVTFTDLTASRTIGTPMDTPLHPVQLYESLATFLIFAFLLWLAPRKGFHGQVALTYVALYSTARFVLEFWRGDPDRGSWFGGVVSTSQLIAVVLLLGAALIVPRVRQTQRVAVAA